MDGTASYGKEVRLDFRLLDAAGSVEVTVERDTNPEALGYPPFAAISLSVRQPSRMTGRGTERLLGGCSSCAPPMAWAAERSSNSILSRRSVDLLIRFASSALAPCCSMHRRDGPATTRFGAPRASSVSSRWIAASAKRERSSDSRGVQHPRRVDLARTAVESRPDRVGQAPGASTSRASRLGFREGLSARLKGREREALSACRRAAG